MSTKVQRRRGTTAEHSTFTGAAGELTVDTDKDVVVVHDGTTVGGHPMLKQDLSNLPAGSIDNADIASNAAIADTKLATIATADKVSLSALNIDGATDLGRDLIYNDYFVVQDFTGGNHRIDAERIATLITGSNNTFTGAQSFTNTGGTKFRQGEFQDGVTLRGRAGGTGAYSVEITPTTLTASRTLTAPNTSGTIITSGDTGSVTSAMIADGTIVNGDIASNAAISYDKLASLPSGNLIVGSSSNIPTTRAITGDVTISATGVTAIGSGVVVNADVSASAAIAGTKISPDFGSQNVTTTGTATAAALIPSGSSVPTNGVYLPSADQVAISTGGTGRLFVAANGRVGIGDNAPGSILSVKTTGITPLKISGASSDLFTVTSDGTLMAGSSTLVTHAGIQPKIQATGIYSSFGSLGLTVFNTTADSAPSLFIGHSKGATVGTYTASVADDLLGEVTFTAGNGTDMRRGASIGAWAEDTWAVNDHPARLVFSTTADGSATPVERMRIDSAGLITTTGSFKDPAITGTILEDIYTITDGAAFEVDPGNGSVQLITLGANRTPKATNFAAGEAVTLMINDGTASTLTWTDTTWGTTGVRWSGGSAPVLATSGYTVVQFWKVGSQVYGAHVGDVA